MGIGSANPLLLATAASGGSEEGSGGASDPVTRSLRFNDGNNSGLYFDPTATHDSTTVYTFSCWAKLGEMSAESYEIFTAGYYSSGSSQDLMYFGHNADSKMRVWLRSTHDSTNTTYTSTAVFRDPSAWCHLTLVRSGASLKVYVNNSEVISETISSTQRYGVGNGYPMHIGSSVKPTSSSVSNYGSFDGLLADVYFTDGYAKAPTDFIESNGYGGYKPKAYTGSFGTNGFHLKFDDSSDIGEDSTSNSNDFTANNISSSHDTLPDTPTQNYAVLNPLDIKNTVSSTSEGNLKLTGYFSTYYPRFVSTIAVNSGKWYWEVCKVGTSTTWANEAGVKAVNTPSPTGGHGLGGGSAFATYQELSLNSYDGNYRNGSGSTVNLGAWNSDEDIIGIALDLDSSTKTIQFYKNGSALGSAQNIPAGEYTWTPAFDCLPGSGTNELRVNYGQDNTFAGKITSGQDTSQSEFYYAPPTGFKSLNSSNLDAPPVNPTAHFNTVLYNGTYDSYMGSGTSSQSITGVGFSPDICWIKDRDNQAGNSNSYYGHYWFDTVLGTGSAINIDAEQGLSGSLNSSEDGVSSFDSDGFTVDEAEETNFLFDDGMGYTEAERYVAWCWKLGTTASSWSGGGQNPDSEQYNSDAGMSIINYYDYDGNGTSIEFNHSLGAAPEFAMALDYEGYHSANYAWHKDLSSGNYLDLSSTGSQTSDSTYFPSSPATNTTFTAGVSLVDSIQTHVALFRSVEGFSKFGSYEGNNNSNGPFVYCGFRPRWIIVKRIDGTSGWNIIDTARDTYNDTDATLHADTSLDEGSFAATADFDILSNGFKLRHNMTYGYSNQTDTHIFAAFAESPFKYANAR